MKANKFLDIVHTIEHLKNVLRHCDTSSGRRESVAEHSWRIATMAMLLSHEYQDVDMNRVIKMCLVHDLGEIFTGDIPVFDKTSKDEINEEIALKKWLETLPETIKDELSILYDEMNARQTKEAKIYKALDSMEAVIQHNEADISTWAEHEYDLQLHHGYDKVDFDSYLLEIRDLVKAESIEKIKRKGE